MNSMEKAKNEMLLEEEVQKEDNVTIKNIENKITDLHEVLNLFKTQEILKNK